LPKDGDRKGIDSKQAEDGDKSDPAAKKDRDQDRPRSRPNEAAGIAGRPDREQMRAAIIKRFDKDDDGKLSDEERAAARKAFEERRGGGERNRGPRGGGPRADHGRPDREKMRAEMLKRFDKDGDGKMNDEERAEMRKQFEARRGGRGGP